MAAVVASRRTSFTLYIVGRFIYFYFFHFHHDEGPVRLSHFAMLMYLTDGADDILIGDEGELDEAAGGEMQSTRYDSKWDACKQNVILSTHPLLENIISYPLQSH